ncbi:MAG: hypothetical protein AVDCRST_MAG87-2533 [uncultured Thermomicrobiales bacterium]|uniref:Uncharacterized protein n=1 Tax=uncultured Thermomicrobiales bacterium TaxID=1645740 RepID=A0A6J4V917_9BACT|nr:MAG: hypothetical protein AVDCRST_MAG87-2533 [uncultured Thermomicrobiales bacterium]
MIGPVAVRALTAAYQVSPTRIGLGSRQEVMLSGPGSVSYQRGSACATGFRSCFRQSIRSSEVAKAVRWTMPSSARASAV